MSEDMGAFCSAGLGRDHQLYPHEMTAHCLLDCDDCRSREAIRAPTLAKVRILMMMMMSDDADEG